MIRAVNKIYLFILIIFPSCLIAQNNSEINWFVFSNGFNNSVNINNKVISQVGTALIGTSSNEVTKVKSGFLTGLITTFATSVNDNENQPLSYELYQNYPNPFNPATVIRFSIPQANIVLLKVYDILGSEVLSLLNEEKPAGLYEITFDAYNLASGIYIYKLQAGDFNEKKKMILLK
jgi:hypothetical protein